MNQKAYGARRFALALSVAAVVAALVTAKPAAAQTGLQYIAVIPCRIADTRNSSFNSAPYENGPPSLTAGATRAFFVKGRCTIPNTAKAVSVNAAILNPTAPGFLSLWPAGGAYPGISTINFVAGEPGLANGAIVPLNVCASPCGDLNVVYGNDGTAGQTLNFVLDVTGYFQ
jgi:hypothetical protein